MTLIPKGFTVLVLPIDAEEDIKKDNKESLIVIPKSVKDEQRINVSRGTVIAVGNCAWKDLGDGTPWAKVGDKILYAQFGGKFVDVGGVEHVIIQDKDVMGVYEGD